MESNRRDFLKLLGIGAAVAVLPMPSAIAHIVEESVLPEPDQRLYEGMTFVRNGVVSRIGHLYQMTVRAPQVEEYETFGRVERFRRHSEEPIELELSATREEATAAMDVISTYHESMFGAAPYDYRGTLYSELKLVSPHGNKTIRFQIGGAIFQDVDCAYLPPQRPGEKLTEYRGTPYRFDAGGNPLETLKLAINVHRASMDWVEV